MMILTQNEGVIEFRDDEVDFVFLRIEKLSEVEIEKGGERCEHDSGFFVEGDEKDEIEGAIDRLSRLSDEEIEAQRPSWDNANPTLDDIIAKHAYYEANPPKRADEALQCQQPATTIVTICDAPELALDPDRYFYCNQHAAPTIGAYILSELG